jgi:hypothetical protein
MLCVTNNNFVVFDGNTGKFIKDSNYTADSFALKQHMHTTDDITGGTEIWCLNCGTSTTVLD